MNRKLRFLCRPVGGALLAAGLLTASPAQASPNVSHTIAAGATGNISDSTQYTAGGAPSNTTAGDILQDVATSAPAAFTLTVDIPVTIGTIKLNSLGAHSGTFSAGAGAFTMDNTGGTVTNIFGNTNASIGENANAGTLTIGANVIAANANLDIGSTQVGTVVISGNITASTAITLNLRQNATQTSTTIFDQITGSIGASGSAIAINNVSSGGGGGNKDNFNISGSIGGLVGTGAAVTITNAATGSAPLNISGALGASVSSLTQNSATSTMTISGANSAFAGTASIQAGTLTVSSATGLGTSAVTLANNAGATLNVTTATSIGSLSGGGTTGGNVTLTGTLTTGSLNATPTYAGAISGVGGLTKVGTGTLTLTGTNTYTGTTAVNNGTLALDFTAANAPASNILGNTTAAALNMGGGTLNVIGAAAGSTQTFSATAISSGGNVITAAPTAGGTIPTVNLGTLTATQGGLVRFDGAAFNNGATAAGGATIGGGTVAATATFNATANTRTGGIISNTTADPASGYATVGAYDWAAISTGVAGTAQAGTIVGGSQIAGFYTVGTPQGNTFALNIDMNASGTLDGNSTSQSANYDTIRFNVNAALTLGTGRALAGSVVGGFLVTPNVGAFNTTIAAGTAALQASRSANGATGLTVWQNNTQGELVISAIYSNGSNSGLTSSYTQGGPGTVVLSGANTYSGLTFLDGGTTFINTNSSLGAPATGATVNINGGTLLGAGAITLDNAGANARSINLNGAGGTLAAATGGNLTVTGVIAGAGNLTVGSGTLAGTGAGSANPTAIVGNGILTLAAANTYSGATTVNAGTLLISTGSINASNAVTLAGTSILTIQNATALSDAGLLTMVTGTTLNLDGTIGTTEIINSLVLNGTPEAPGTYTAAQLAALPGATGINFASANGETLTILSGLTAVPEPGTLATLLTALVGSGLAARRHRRSRDLSTIQS